MAGCCKGRSADAVCLPVFIYFIFICKWWVLVVFGRPTLERVRFCAPRPLAARTAVEGDLSMPSLHLTMAAGREVGVGEGDS